MLRDLWVLQGQPDEGLVIIGHCRLPITPDRYSTLFRQLCEQAGVPRLTRIHNTRHSLALMFAEAGKPA